MPARNTQSIATPPPQRMLRPRPAVQVRAERSAVAGVASAATAGISGDTNIGSVGDGTGMTPGFLGPEPSAVGALLATARAKSSASAVAVG